MKSCNCTIFAPYVETGFATQVILNTRLTRFYERDDWKRRLSMAKGNEPLLLERGIDFDDLENEARISNLRNWSKRNKVGISWFLPLPGRRIQSQRSRKKRSAGLRELVSALT